MNIPNQVVNTTIKGLSQLLCRIDSSQLPLVPHNGRLILVANHINFLDAPVVYAQLQSRQVTGLVKIETWDNPFLGALLSIYGGIPIRRGQADVKAMRLALSALAEGQIVAVAPEGTHSGDGCLRRGQPGVVTLVLHSHAPLLPIAYYGYEHFQQNMRRFQRTDFHIAVGRPFTIDFSKIRLTQALRQEITDQIMYQVAQLLPPQYRGVYADLSRMKPDYFIFDDEILTA